MMDNLRAATNHIVIKVILILIILSFILTGLGGYLTGTASDTFAAKVNDQKITLLQLEQAVQREHAILQQQLGEQFAILASRKNYMQQLRQQVLNQLINNMLIDQYASKLGITVNDEEVKESIRHIPFFQSAGKFDNDKYKELVQRMGYTLEQFAQLQRRQLMHQQALYPFTETGFIFPTELQSASELILQQRAIRLMTIDIKTLQTQQQVNNEELKTYYEQNKNSFIAPEKLKISYIAIDATTIPGKITVSDEEINTYYTQHKRNYTQPERKNYSVIQSDSEAEAQIALNMLKKGADFATVAKEKSIDIISRKNGGQLGWLEPETTADELKQANLTKPGEFSDIIKSSVGYLIVRLNDIKPEQVQPLAHVHTTIVEQIKREKEADAYYTLQQKISDAIVNDNQSLTSIEKIAGVNAKVTDWFTRDTIPDALNFKPVLENLFDGSLVGENNATGTGKISNVITVEGDRAFILRINERQPESIQPFNQVQPQITEMVSRQKALQQAHSKGEKLLLSLQQGKNDNVPETTELNFSEKKTISRSLDEPWIETTFSLPLPHKGKPVYGLGRDSQDNIVLIELQSVTAGHLTKDETQPFTTRMKENFNKITLDALIENLRQKATIQFSDMGQLSQ